ncbi:AAA family ATPase [Kitasatospora sp. NPDC090091]|uniref:AAA family ATPase n=1 Tax=Kitasatospora sp. NPDC090091 TaxID=3364081 RepID=UPI003815054B
MTEAVPPGPAESARAAVARIVPDPPTLRASLDSLGYLADPGLTTALYLAVRLPQPLLLEGEPGVGKTEAARALAGVLGSPLIRLQCYDGLDAAEALYEWNYPRQLLSIRLAESRGVPLAEADLFSDDFLLRRPILAALTHPGPMPAVLLIDEIDRADDDFEAFLLEVLAEAGVTIPELGTVRATVAPVVVLTSNRTRDLHDALKRRCLYHWIDYPDTAQVIEIVRRRAPGTTPSLAADVAASVRRMRTLEIQKPPGIAESIDWVGALALLGVERLDTEAADRTLGVLVKYREDIDLVRDRGLAWLVGTPES